MLKETRTLPPFQKVLLKSYGEFIIKQGESEELTIEGEKPLIDHTFIEVHEGQLTIQMRGSLLEHLNWLIKRGWQPLYLRFTLTLKDMEALELWGAGKVQVPSLKTQQIMVRLKGAGEIIIEDLQAQTLIAHLPGAGRISISGETNTQQITITGTGSYDSPLLKSNHADARLSGIGSATLWATDTLTATVHGMGSISYYGYPTLQEECHGLGKIIPLGAPVEQEIFASSTNAGTSTPNADQAFPKTYSDSTQPSFHTENMEYNASNSTPSTAYEGEQEAKELFTHPKPHADVLAHTIWGLIFIWAGSILLANNLGWLTAWFEPLPFRSLIRLEHFSFGAWSLVALGAALLLAIEVLIRLIIPSLRKGWIGKLILMLILFVIGLDGIISWMVIIPAFLFLLGFSLVLRVILHR